MPYLIRMDKATEEVLIEGCLKSDRKAQKQLYDHFSPKMMVVALRYSKSEQEAEDILQEAFLKVFKHLKNFRSESKLGTWIQRIVVNTALNYHRSKLYLFPMNDVKELKNLKEPEIALSGFHFKELIDMIQSLPDGCQVIFNLYALEGYSHKEIAEKLGISEGTSKSQYSRAKVLLRERIIKSEKINYG